MLIQMLAIELRFSRLVTTVNPVTAAVADLDAMLAALASLGTGGEVIAEL